MAKPKKDRKCARCGKKLSMYNKTATCHACDDPRDAVIRTRHSTRIH